MVRLAVYGIIILSTFFVQSANAVIDRCESCPVTKSLEDLYCSSSFLLKVRVVNTTYINYETKSASGFEMNEYHYGIKIEETFKHDKLQEDGTLFQAILVFTHPQLYPFYFIEGRTYLIMGFYNWSLENAKDSFEYYYSVNGCQGVHVDVDKQPGDAEQLLKIATTKHNQC